MTFKWPGPHGVYRIPSGTCPDVFAPGNGLTELAPVVSNGAFTTPALAAGTYWYACQVSLVHLNEVTLVIMNGTSCHHFLPLGWRIWAQH